LTILQTFSTFLSVHEEKLPECSKSSIKSVATFQLKKNHTSVSSL